MPHSPKTCIVKNDSGDLIIKRAPEGESTESSSDLYKRLHDLRGAVKTIGFCTQNLKDGYHFDDQMAAAKVEALEKAQKVISKEFTLLEEIFQTWLED